MGTIINTILFIILLLLAGYGAYRLYIDNQGDTNKIIKKITHKAKRVKKALVESDDEGNTNCPQKKGEKK
ncbi:MAG: hypothetical protein ACXABD_20675 [Candidatus Thorarchaeota archaeon]|jgi:uncharacterized protein YxeA